MVNGSKACVCCVWKSYKYLRTNAKSCNKYFTLIYVIVCTVFLTCGVFLCFYEVLKFCNRYQHTYYYLYLYSTLVFFFMIELRILHYMLFPSRQDYYCTTKGGRSQCSFVIAPGKKNIHMYVGLFIYFTHLNTTNVYRIFKKLTQL